MTGQKKRRNPIQEMSRPVADTDNVVQKPDDSESGPNKTTVISSGPTPHERCLAIMSPFCTAMLPPNKKVCNQINNVLCQPGSSYLECLIGNTAEGPPVGFLALCLCAPASLKVTEDHVGSGAARRP